MKKKKWTMVPLVMTLLCSSVAVTMADNTTQPTTTTSASQEQALQKAKQAFGIGDDFKLTGVQTSDNGGNANPTWIFSFQKNEFAHHISNSVVVDAKTQEILHFDQYEETPDKNGIYTKEAAHDNALALIAKLQPEKAKQVVEVPVTNSDFVPESTAYAFHFVRKVNGILFPANGFTVRIDAKGNVTTYDYTWGVADDSLPKVEGVLDKDKALAAYVEQNPMGLRYQTSYLPGDPTPQVHLIYLNSDVNDSWSFRPILDAKSGKLINSFEQEVPTQGPFTPVSDQAGANPVTGELDKEAALKLVKSWVHLDDSYTLQNSSLDTQGNQKVWSFQWSKGDQMTGAQLYVTLDAKTGELLNLSANDRNNGKSTDATTPKLTWSEMRDKALAFFKLAVPTKTNSFALLTTHQPVVGDDPGKENRVFSFGHLVNGVLEMGHGAAITVDENTGAILQFSGEYGSILSKENYPDPKQAMSVQAAEQKFLAQYPLQLMYVQTYEQGPWTPYGGSNIPSNVILAYAPLGADTGYNLDAITGEWLKLNGQLAESKSVADLQGHWAQQQVQSLVDKGVYKLDAEKKVHPDGTITRAEAIRVLVMTVGQNRLSTQSGSSFQDVAPTDPNHDFIETAVFMGWVPNDIQKFHPNDPLTREELAKWSTKILGYGKLSSKKNVFLKPFSDLTAQDEPYLGAISVVNALGVMQGNGGKFNPHGNVTRAQLAIVVNRLVDEYQSMPHSMW